MMTRAGWMRLAAAIASGLLVAGLFPPFPLAVLVWVALVPLLVALWSLKGTRAGRKGFFLGWLAGVISNFVQFRWLGVVSPLGMVALPIYLGLFWAAFGAFAATLGNPWRNEAGAHNVPGRKSAIRVAGRALRVAICLGTVWAGLEVLRGWLFTGFGWNGLGVAFHDTRLFAQAADLLGVAGLSLVVVFFQAVLVQAGRRMFARQRGVPLDVLTTLAALGLLAAYGGVRIALEHGKQAVRLKALLVQINIPQEAAQRTWDPLDIHLAYEEDTVVALEQLKARGPDQWPDWVVWPESALSGRILRAADGTWGTWRENADSIAQVRKAGPFQLIYGINELEAEVTGDHQLVMKDKGRAWNSLAVMSPDDDLQTYRKHHLVIFGETIPFVDRIPLLKKIYEQQAGIEYGGSFTPGESFEPLPVPTAKGAVLSAIPTVCFEDSVGRLVRHFVRPVPQLIVNVTNDGWFKESPAADQHFANARFRAIELRRPMLRCANTGVSAAVDTTGSTAHPDSGRPQVLTDARGSHFTRGTMLAELDVPLQPSFSLYALIGDGGVVVLALLGFAWAWQIRRNNYSQAVHN